MDRPNGLQRVREKVRKYPNEKLTNLFTHLKVDLFHEVFRHLKKGAAAGVDGVTWEEYAEGLDERLAELQDRLHRGAYRPLPVRRTYIPKADGRQRPIGIPAVEDKIVQGAVVAVLTPVYEEIFLDSSYGFRPKRNQHQALEAIDRMAYRSKVNCVLDADVKAYFDTIQHDKLIEMVEERIGDSRLIRLIRKWLKAGVLEDAKRMATEEGTPQGGLISPLLANIYLHYVLDQWTKTRAEGMKGEVHLVRYADDFLVGFEYKFEAEAYHEELRKRMEEYGLTLHPVKTHLLWFGRFAERNAARDGLRRPETFDFLGFTHISGRSARTGRFLLVRRTKRKKRLAKQQELKEEVHRRKHWQLVDQWNWLCSVLRGHYQYYGVSTNIQALRSFYAWLRRTWHRALQRRSQRAKKTRAQLDRFDRRYPLPKPRIVRGLQLTLHL